jgi:transglutaminase-like putative cysteine protease
MKQTPAQPRWWDWTSLALLFVLLHISAWRLVATDWTENLSFVQSLTSMGFAVGLALGYSHFKPARARWLSLLYMLVLAPLAWVRIIDAHVAIDERLLSVFGRLLLSINILAAKKPVEDQLFFVAVMSLSFWILSASAGFHLARRQNFLAAVVPSAIGILVIQHYDNHTSGGIWFVGFYIFFALCLLGRLNFLQNKQTWRQRRVLLSAESSLDLTTSMALISGLLILTAWLMPTSIQHNESFRQTWKRLTAPWTRLTDKLENAVSALDSTTPGTPNSFYGTELKLGEGFPLSTALMFRVQAPYLSSRQQPPRYYWRGRVYDRYDDGQWYMTGAETTDFVPESAPAPSTARGLPVRFIVTLGTSKSALIYAPAQPVWFSRPGSYLAAPNHDIFSWSASPALQAGETYQVDSIIHNPHVEELRAAGADYPEWISKKYLQLPSDFSPRIAALALEIAANAETPYDKTLAITRYLRNNIEYADTVPSAPPRQDLLEWMLFEHKQAYCVYYATAEIMMLRSLGIPARMAVGFSQGEEINIGAENAEYRAWRVLKKNAHAWPEVYFPGIGWVEFEPTGNQNELIRPFLPTQTTNNFTPPTNNLPQEELGGNFASRNPELEEGIDQSSLADSRLNTTLYLILFLTAFTALTILLNRRYNFAIRAPALLHATLERAGIEIPPWLLRWEYWNSVTPIERAFESVNFGLRQMKHSAAIHATPSERAESLANVLPRLQPVIKILLDEHNTSLYTSRSADEKKAFQAALQIRAHTMLALVRHFLTGRYEAEPPQAE